MALHELKYQNRIGRKGNPSMKIAKIGRIDAISVENTIGSFFTAENVLYSDSNPSILAWAKRINLEHHTFVAYVNMLRTNVIMFNT